MEVALFAAGRRRRRPRVRMAIARPGFPAPVLRAARRAACVALVAVELLVSLSMWVLIPLAWIWIGSRVYHLTGSLAADCGVALLGFAVTVFAAMAGLARLDELWVALRVRAGHDQKEGALTRVVIFSATLGLIGFFVWYYALSKAYIIPFMPSH
jgi:hypothetical protein